MNTYLYILLYDFGVVLHNYWHLTNDRSFRGDSWIKNKTPLWHNACNCDTDKPKLDQHSSSTFVNKHTYALQLLNCILLQLWKRPVRRTASAPVAGSKFRSGQRRRLSQRLRQFKRSWRSTKLSWALRLV